MQDVSCYRHYANIKSNDLPPSCPDRPKLVPRKSQILYLDRSARNWAEWFRHVAALLRRDLQEYAN